MALAARTAFCQLRAGAEKEAVEIQKTKVVDAPAVQLSENYGKIVLQPRLCTLRSFAGERGGVMKQARNQKVDVSRFFETLSDYMESSKKSEDFEIISGRLAMIVFAATLSVEVVTGNSVFRKLDVQGISEAAGVCLAAVTGAALFAWFSSARNRVGPIFTSSCNTFIDSFIDQIIDGLFYDSDIHDWSDDI